MIHKAKNIVQQWSKFKIEIVKFLILIPSKPLKIIFFISATIDEMSSLFITGTYMS